MSSTTEVADLYAELTNKIRWAISTSWRAYGQEIGYKEAMELASGLSSDALSVLMERGNKSGIHTSSPNGRSGGKRGG